MPTSRAGYLFPVTVHSAPEGFRGPTPKAQETRKGLHEETPDTVGPIHLRAEYTGGLFVKRGPEDTDEVVDVGEN